MTALTVDSLTRSFGDLTVVDDATFTLDPGRVTCLVGPNGSGKTTLLRVVAGVLAPDSGTVETPSDAPRPVGYLAQEPAFRPQFTVRETLSFYADLVPAPVDVDAALDRVGLGGVPDRRVEALSGGMTRLLGIAQATIGDPPLLLLDEPSSGLDPMMSHHVTSVITDIAADGAAVLVATHDLGSVQRIADDVLVLDRGQVVGRGAPADLLAETDSEDLESAIATLVEYERGEVATRREASDDRATSARADSDGANESATETRDAADGSPADREVDR